MIPINVHSFSRPFAKDHGVSAAVLMKHLAYKVGRSQTMKEGKRWHYNSAKKLQAKLPYLSCSTISSQLKSMEQKKLLELGNFNRWPHDKTQWYHVPDHVRFEVKEDIVSFDADVAKDVGILAAVLHYNLYYFIRNQVRKKVKAPKHTMSPKALTDLLPFSKSAIKKALGKLEDKGLIVKMSEPRSTFTLPECDLVLMRQFK